MSNPKSVFVALPAPPELHAYLAEAEQACRQHLTPEQVNRWNGEAKWHLTLAYLGKHGKAGQAKAQEVFATLPPPPELILETAEINHFHPGEPFTFHIRIKPTPELNAWQKVVRSAFTEAGFSDRSHAGFTPHITLGYFQTEHVSTAQAEALQAETPQPPLSFSVDQTVLYLNDSGSYSHLGEISHEKPPHSL